MSNREAVINHLKTIHQRYCDWNQAPRADTVYMANNGHPFAKEYGTLREFFDSLKFAANAGARFYTYEDQNNYSEYWAPQLSVTWQAFGYRGFEGDVFPAQGERWQRYLEALKEDHWPASQQPVLCGGDWLVVTGDTTLLQNLRYLGAQVRARNEDASCYQASMHDVSLSLFRQIKKLIDKYQPNGQLPTRTHADDRADTQVLPLPLKKIMLGNVDRVTVKDRHVVVPLLPLDNRLDETVNRIVSDLCQLMDAGFRFAVCEHWLEQQLDPASFRAVKKRYRPDPNEEDAL